MDIAQLRQHIKQPDLHRRILQGYPGAYSLGITLDADGNARFLLRVEDENPNRFARKVDVDGESVAVEIRTGFQPPQPLAH